MKIILLLFFLIPVVLLSGCSVTLDDFVDQYDRTCVEDTDCQAVCPVGCINVAEEYDEPVDIECEQVSCACVDSKCQDRP